jgi:general stress protein YciG
VECATATANSGFVLSSNGALNGRQNKKAFHARFRVDVSRERRREVSALGGKSLANEKRTFSLDRTKASDAGKKGGASVPPDARTFSQDRDLASESGRKGGIATRMSQKHRDQQT